MDSAICPRLNPPWDYRPVLQNTNNAFLIISTYNRSARTEVSITGCYDANRILVGATDIVCHPSGAWAPEPPSCIEPDVASWIQDNMELVIGLSAVLGLILLLSFIAIIVCCCQDCCCCCHRSSSKTTTTHFFNTPTNPPPPPPAYAYPDRRRSSRASRPSVIVVPGYAPASRRSTYASSSGYRNSVAPSAAYPYRNSVASSAGADYRRSSIGDIGSLRSFTPRGVEVVYDTV